MRILMLAPEPFFKPRGTPISIYFRIKALSDLGHKTDLITYSIGEDVRIKNLEILRIPRLFFIRKIKIGPSLKKIILDFFLLLKAIIQLRKKRYELIFSHEEAALLGTILAKIWHQPHIYDMHSSLPQQIENSGASCSQILKRIFVWIENFILKNSDAVIVICPDLLKKAEEKECGSKTVLLENFIHFEHQQCPKEKIKKKREEFVPEGGKIALYAGNFQPYQGLSLLLDAASKIKQVKVVFVLVGGSRSEREKIRNKAKAIKISDKVRLIAELPPAQIPILISAADVLVSPRLSGTNIPLKIYSFLKSGKPVVATRLKAHTQILNDKISVLVEPDGESLAEGISFALFDEEAKRRARAAKDWAEREYSYSKYLEKINEVLEIVKTKREKIET